MFADRTEAGRELAGKLAAAQVRPAVTLALGTDAVAVAVEIARRLGGAVDLIFVEGVGPPLQPDLHLATLVAYDRPEVAVERTCARALGIPPEDLEAAAARVFYRLESWRHTIVGNSAPPPLGGCRVVLAGDGLAPETAVRAAVRFLRRQRVRALTVALPLAQRDLLAWLREQAGCTVCLEPHDRLAAPWLHYRSAAPVDPYAAAHLIASVRPQDCGAGPDGRSSA
jgi:putative phosphoribosyl transferase